MNATTNITIYRNRQATFTVTVTKDSVAQNVTGGTFKFTAKSSYNAAAPLFQKTVGSGITLTTPISGIITVVISASDTASLPNTRFLGVYDLTYVPSGGTDSITLLSGQLEVLPSVG